MERQAPRDRLSRPLVPVMKIDIRQVEYKEVMPFRELYRHEANCQIVHDSSLSRGFGDTYLLSIDGRMAAYGAVFIKHYVGRLFEFYTLPYTRDHALPMFRELLAASKATEIEAQSNMPLMLEMLNANGTEIVEESVLFQDFATTHLAGPTDGVRRFRQGDPVTNEGEPQGDWVLEVDGAVVANGGYLCHYNPPYGDIYMETAPEFRQKGHGSFLVQELKRICYENGKKPGARCNPTNVASRRTLERAGFHAVGHMLAGKVAGA